MHQYETVIFNPASGTNPAQANFDLAADTIVNATPSPLTWIDPKSIYITQGNLVSDYRLRSKWGNDTARTLANGTARPAVTTIGAKGAAALGFGLAGSTVTQNGNGAIKFPNKRILSNTGYAIAWNMKVGLAANGAGGIFFATDELAAFFSMSVDTSGRLVVTHQTGQPFDLRNALDLRNQTDSYAIWYDFTTKTLRFYKNKVLLQTVTGVAREYLGAGFFRMGGSPLVSLESNDNRAVDISIGQMVIFDGSVTPVALNRAMDYVAALL